MPPHQVIVQEPQTGTKYKRLVIPLVVCGDIVFKVEEKGAVEVTSTKFAEVVIEAHPSLLTNASLQAIQDQPLEAFKKMVASSGIPMQELGIYSYRKVNGFEGYQVHQCIMKIPSDKTNELLKISGKTDFFIRCFLQQDESADHSLLPRYWSISGEEVRKAYQLGHSLGESFRGLALTPKGVCIRAANDALGAARKLILQGDVRFCDLNRHVICRHMYTAQGFPFAVSHECVTQATKTASGQPCVPLRSYRAGGLHTWVLGFADHPTHLVFSVKVDGQTHEVILAPQTNIRTFKPNKKQQGNKPPGDKAKSSSAAIMPPPVATQINMTPAENRYQTLEARVNKLEVQQTALSDKVDCGFSKMSLQLQQVLDAVAGSASSGGKTRGPETSGETPPPKKSK